MPCVICGDFKTVQSHLLPRALYRWIADGEQHGYEGNVWAKGIKYQAKGAFDPDLLCNTHEGMLCEADTYGIAFIKSFEAAGRETNGGQLWTVPNPHPDRLVKFIAACVWRRVASRVGLPDGAPTLSLGSAESKVRGLLFENDRTFDPPILIRRVRLTSQGEPVDKIMFEPVPSKDFGHNAWVFYCVGVELHIKMNPYSIPEISPFLRANGKTTVTAVNPEPQEWSDIRSFVNIARNMFPAARDR